MAAAMIAIALSALSLLIGCSPPREEHLIPEGFTGPVVIVFGSREGGRRSDRDSVQRFEIPNDGLLRLSANDLREGVIDPEYFVVHPGGAMERIPSHAEENVFQVFGVITGTLPIQDRRVLFKAYVVGVPSALPDWPEQRNAAVERATRAESAQP